MNKHIAAVVLGSAASMALAAPAPSIDKTYSRYVNKTGAISLPANIQQDWSHLGSYVVHTSEDGKAGIDVHQVYTQPTSIDYYRKHQRFPDGAVLVKTVSGTTSETLTTGKVNYANALKVTFVMVKDDKNRFPTNKAWGEGWGWALFDPTKPGKSQTTDWKGEGFNNCFGCHIPVKQNDWVYTQGYEDILTP
ncbi:Uncharacterised protein [BD1-7 clade bacterium]|uniref:Cytochrome P460 domain-containing protein n=1 Tax=BD1-7 clade bacterium TaxID=2029982 RepID=A0A5S9PC12_9GAMM|nr:Uncharacterised protein [BD1-7 clade bacterium]CAA0101207.1 Uncharacterised protein [BD1-7 clade bacterium]